MLAMRSIDRIVNTHQFAEAFKIDKDHTDLNDAIQHCNAEWVHDWIDETLTKEIGELSMRDLRTKAAQYRILRYTSLSKDQLIVALTQAIHHARETQKAAFAVPSVEERSGASSHDEHGREVSPATSVGGTDALGDGERSGEEG